MCDNVDNEEYYRRREAAAVQEEKQLTEKQKRFVREWLVDMAQELPSVPDTARRAPPRPPAGS